MISEGVLGFLGRGYWGGTSDTEAGNDCRMCFAGRSSILENIVGVGVGLVIVSSVLTFCLFYQ